MAKRQVSVLRKAKAGVHFDKLNQKDRDALLYLVDQNLVKSRCDVGGDGFFLITEAGKQALSDRWGKAVRQIATALAAIATLAVGLIGLLNQLGLLSVQAG